MRRSTKLLVGAGTGIVVLAIIAVMAYANLTRIVRAVLEDQVPGLTFKELDVGWNNVSITGVNLERGKRTVFKVDLLRVRPSLWSLFSDTLYIASIDIEKPYVYLVRNADGSLTLPVPEGMEKSESGSARQPKPEEKKEAEEGSMALFIERIRLRDGKGDLVDHSVQGRPAKITLSDLDVSVEKVAVPAGSEPIAFDVSMRLEGKRTGNMAAEGWYHPTQQSAELDLDMRELFLPTAEPYYRSNKTTATLTDGILELDTEVEMKEGRYVAKNRLSISDVAFSKEGLFLGVPVALFQKHLKDQGKPFVVAVDIEGSLDDRSKLQQQLVSAVVKALAKEVGEKALSDLAGKAMKGGPQEAEKALHKLFGQ